MSLLVSRINVEEFWPTLRYIGLWAFVYAQPRLGPTTVFLDFVLAIATP